MVFLIPLVIWVNCNGDVAQHGLNTRRRDDQLVAVRIVFNLVRERRDHPKLNFLQVSWEMQLSRTFHVEVMQLEIRKRRLQLATPIFQSTSAV